MSTASATESAASFSCGASAACSSWSACSWGGAVASASSADSTTNDLLRGLRMVAGVRADFLFAVFLPLRLRRAGAGAGASAACSGAWRASRNKYWSPSESLSGAPLGLASLYVP